MEKEELELEEILKSIDMLSETDTQSGQQKAAAQDETMYSREHLEEMGFCEPQMDEIALGLSQQLPVWQYARICYNWKQMREIRMGLLENLDVSQYDNALFSAEQMREIRMGLMDHLDVSSYANLIFSTKDMAAIRNNLLSDAYQEHPSGFAREIADEEHGLRIRISDDCMQAYLTLPKESSFSALELERILSRHGIIHGIRKKQLRLAADGGAAAGEIMVAQGTPSVQGKDGKYEYFFNALLPGEPTVLEDGSVDYTQVVVADKRNAGEILARYLPAESGEDGETVTGIAIRGTRGQQLPVLQGEGIARDAAHNIYTAARSGYVLLDEEEGTLNVWDVYEVDGDVNRYTGHISYNGIVHIRGSVREMAEIEAAGNVVVDGYVEAAHIRAGENIILRSGMNGCGVGKLEAGGKVAGKFFEAAQIIAGGKVEANYFLNCHVTTDESVLAKGTKSKIMGSTIQAGYAVEACGVTDVGREATYISVGDPLWLGKREKQAQENLEKVQDELRQLREGKKKVAGMFGGEAVQDNSLFHKICVAIRMKTEEEREKKAELAYMELVLRRAGKAYIRIHHRIQQGVKVSVHGKTRKLEKDMTGLVTFQ